MNTKPRGTRRPPNTVIAKTILPEDRSTALDHLALDLGLSKAMLLADGALLVLQLFSRGDGLGDLVSPGVAEMRGVRR